jgi:hypothetical protein
MTTVYCLCYYEITIKFLSHNISQVICGNFFHRLNHLTFDIQLTICEHLVYRIYISSNILTVFLRS